MTESINMLLFCPRCHVQHIDAPDARSVDWVNPPHRSHLCHSCGTIWRPADVPTNGVARLETVGKADNWHVLMYAPDKQNPASPCGPAMETMMALIGLPNGYYIDPKTVVGVRPIINDNLSPRVLLNTTPGQLIVLEFDLPESAKAWARDFAGQVNVATSVGVVKHAGSDSPIEG